MEPVKLLERAASSAAHALRHPISSAAYTAGMARGLVGAALHGVTATGHDPEAGPRPVPTQRTSGSHEAVAPPPPPAPGGTASDAEIDAWIDEAMARGEDADDRTPAEEDHAPPDPEPVLDPGTAKAIRSESEMLRRAAERDPR